MSRTKSRTERMPSEENEGDVVDGDTVDVEDVIEDLESVEEEDVEVESVEEEDVDVDIEEEDVDVEEENGNEALFSILNDPVINEIFYATCRSRYLTSDRELECITPSFDCGDEDPLEWFVKNFNQVEFEFEPVAEGSFDPFSEFCVSINGETRVVSRIESPKVMYCKTVDPPTYVLPQCTLCSEGTRVKITDMPNEMMVTSCRHCDKAIAVSCTYQCLVCSTIFAYIGLSATQSEDTPSEEQGIEENDFAAVDEESDS